MAKWPRGKKSKYGLAFATSNKGAMSINRLEQTLVSRQLYPGRPSAIRRGHVGLRAENRIIGRIAKMLRELSR